MFDCLSLHVVHLLFSSFAISQHPAASLAHVTEITSSHTKPDEQPLYPLSGAAAVADVVGASAATTAPSVPPVTATPQENPAGSASTPSSLLDHVSFSIDVI